MSSESESMGDPVEPIVMPLETLLTSIPYGWWVYDLSQDSARMLWRCKLVGRVSGRIEGVHTAGHLTPRLAIDAAIKQLNQRFEHIA